MMRDLRFPLALMLSLLMALTGYGLATARGASGAVDQVELCIGGGPVMVYLDENGQPVAPPHYCPDGALTLLAGVVPPELVLREAAAQAEVPVSAPRCDRVGQVCASAWPRGPPCRV